MHLPFIELTSIKAIDQNNKNRLIYFEDTMKFSTLLIPFAFIIFNTQAISAQWSSTEVQLQAGGEFESVGAPGQAIGTVLTFQHTSAWEYGDNFFFVNQSSYAGKGDLSDSMDMYGEWYSNFSLGKITGKDLSFGPVKDVGFVAGVNFAPEVDSVWALPGANLALDLPGFKFALVNITAFMHTRGADSSKAGDLSSPYVILDEDNSFMVDFVWAYPLKIGATSWSIEGHLEYVDGRTQVNNFGTKELESWILFQPQFRLDVGELIGTPSDRLFAGLKYQYWKNKLGADGIDDNTWQFLAVWRF